MQQLSTYLRLLHSFHCILLFKLIIQQPIKFSHVQKMFPNISSSFLPFSLEFSNVWKWACAHVSDKEGEREGGRERFSSVCLLGDESLWLTHVHLQMHHILPLHNPSSHWHKTHTHKYRASTSLCLSYQSCGEGSHLCPRSSQEVGAAYKREEFLVYYSVGESSAPVRCAGLPCTHDMHAWRKLS